MKYDDKGRIIQATKTELYRNWDITELYELYSFDEYLQRLREIGVEIIDEGGLDMKDSSNLTMKDIRAQVLRELHSYAAKSCDPELLRINRDIQEVFGDTSNHVVTYLERSPRSKESSAIIYSEEVGNPKSGSYHLRIGGYDSTDTTEFYRPLSPHDAPSDINLSALLDEEISYD